MQVAEVFTHSVQSRDGGIHKTCGLSSACLTKVSADATQTGITQAWEEIDESMGENQGDVSRKHGKRA
jgi:hypothetical protein